MERALRNMEGADRSTATPPRVRVWDLPTRLFHWVLAACVLGEAETHA